MTVCLFVGLSVCPLVYLKNYMSKLYMRHSGSVLLRRQCTTLCTSGVVDDVVFSRNGPNIDTRMESTP